MKASQPLFLSPRSPLHWTNSKNSLVAGGNQKSLPRSSTLFPLSDPAPLTTKLWRLRGIHTLRFSCIPIHKSSTNPTSLLSLCLWGQRFPHHFCIRGLPRPLTSHPHLSPKSTIADLTSPRTPQPVRVEHHIKPRKPPRIPPKKKKVKRIPNNLCTNSLDQTFETLARFTSETSRTQIAFHALSNHSC